MTTPSIEAVLDSIPCQGIDFGYCGVSQATTRSFTMHNPTGNTIRYNFQAEGKNFTCSVNQGTLGPKKKQEVTITFQSDEAKVIIATVIVKLAEGSTEVTRVMKVSAIGKYPFITLDAQDIDFESLLVGKTVSRELQLQNSSLVPTSFQIEKVSDDGKDPSIKVDHKSGNLAPGQIVKVTVSYTPEISGVHSYAQFKVSAFGGNEIRFNTKGLAEGYEVNLSVQSVHFGEVQIDANTNRLLNVVNSSDLQTTFQFITDKSNVFSFSQSEGVVKKNSASRIIITFNPPRTGNYYERVFCMVRNHKVLYVDLIGTCYDILTKPIPLSQRHIDSYRHKVIMGAHKKSNIVKEIEDYQQDSFMGSVEVSPDLALEIPIDDPSQVALHKELLQVSSSDLKELKFSSDCIDFAFTESGRLSEPKQFTLENNFGFPVLVDWALLPVLNKTTGQFVKNPFKVTPERQEIDANDTFVFNVDFAPFEPDSYFFQIAQCFLTLLNGNQFKNKKLLTGNHPTGKPGQSMRSGKSGGTGGKTLLGSVKMTKYVDFSSEEIDPPIRLNLRLSGHSFAPGSQPFIPMIKMSNHKLAFPPCSPGESVYQTVQLNNTSDTPVQFKILQDSTGTYKSFPTLGQVPGKSFALATFEFNPKSSRFYNFSAQFVFNNSSANVQAVLLQGYCYGPSISFPQDKLFYPPSFVGVSTKQKFLVKNDSRIPLEYEWRVPEKYKNEVSFNPNKAILSPNEEAKLVAVFTPLKKKEYQVTIPLFTRNLFDQVKSTIGFFQPGSGLTLTQENKCGLEAPISNKSITIIGAGSDGLIEISPLKLDFGTITVGFTKTLSVVITNKSKCNLYIELKMMQTSKDQDSTRAQHLQQILNECFKFDSHKGVVNAKSKKKVNITFKPSQRFEIETSLVCIAKEKMTKELNQSMKLQKSQGLNSREVGYEEKASIKIHCKGDFPLLRFTDVRNDQVSIANLWERFMLTKMNKELLLPLSPAEITFNNSDQVNSSNDEMQKGLTQFSWDFGKVPIKNGSKPRRISLTLKNIGGVSADWAFKMPNDSEIEMETWADPGEPSTEQAFEKDILEKKIFTIEPRRGSLAPGEQMDLSVNYFPKEVRKHHLNLFFQIANGKPLSIKFEGETLHRRAQLQLIKHTYDLPPVPIGLEWAITYPIEIKNLGITKLKYQIDTEKLEELNKENFDFRVFEIQNPEGTLKSNEIQHIYTLFRPLEAKPYALDLPIRISDIEGPSSEPYTMRLRGIGYHKEEDKPEEVQFYEDLPLCRAHLNDNGSMAAFSTESIDFGELEAGEPSRRFVILYNLNPTQKLKFDFQKSGLMCGDNLRLEPMQGELKPNSHFNIKMTLVPAKYPTNFEGEIQCSIDWEVDAETRGGADAKSVHTTTAAGTETSEYLFLRLKKRSKITKMNLGADVREGESLIENIVNEAMHDIIESEEFDKLLDDCSQSKAGLYASAITNQAQPSKESQIMEEEKLEKGQIYVEESKEVFLNRPGAVYEEELKEVSGVDNAELFRKRMFMQEPFVELMEFMLEDTLFNLMEEATYEEFDLGQPPKIYIRKDN